MRTSGIVFLLIFASIVTGYGRSFSAESMPDVVCHALNEVRRHGDYAKWGTRTGTVIGQTIWWDGTPVPGAQVTFGNAVPGVSAMLTDSAGMFGFDSIAPGDHVIRVEYLGAHTQDHHVAVLPDAVDVLCVVLSPAQALPALVPGRAGEPAGRDGKAHGA